MNSAEKCWRYAGTKRGTEAEEARKYQEAKLAARTDGLERHSAQKS
jgi:hypothetical protein